MGKVLAKRRWLRLIPVVFITYSLAYLDRANFGFAAAGGMAQDLNITPAISSLLGSLFFLGYFFFTDTAFSCVLGHTRHAFILNKIKAIFMCLSQNNTQKLSL